MTALAILWDASHIWGLLAWRAAEAFGLPFRLVKAREIAHGALSDKTSALLVPGGTARHKFAALGPEGRASVRSWVERGGRYIGFCGGAGLGLSDPEHRHGLGLCPWRRAPITEWVQHFVSGHVRVALTPGHALTEAAETPDPALAVWWPGRFAEPPAAERAGDGVDILARYADTSPELCRTDSRFADFCVADLPLASLSDTVLRDWAHIYGVSLAPAFLDGQPCVLHGRRGRGSYTLSYSHLETPGSPEGNRWLARILAALCGLAPGCDVVPAWNPGAEPILWPGLAEEGSGRGAAGPIRSLADARRETEDLLRLGEAHGLLFPRTPWLTGWRAGVPGAGLNNLHTALCVVTSVAPTPAAEAFWRERGASFVSLFGIFARGVRDNLLAFRLAATMPEAVPRRLVTEQRNALFGTAMESGGPYRELLGVLDELLFLSLGGR